MCLEKPTVYGALKAIQQKLGKDAFPLIEQTFHSHHRGMVITPDYPFVAKVAHTHSGFGKMRFTGADPFSYQDFCSVIAINGDYVTLEPFIDWDFDMRIQKIGPHYRAFKRQSGNWKGNTGHQQLSLVDIQVTPRYKTMVDECAKLFGGLDIIGLDLVHSKKDDKEYILELNDTAIGLVHKHADQDMGYMADVVIAHMNRIWCNDGKAEASVATNEASEVREVLSQEIKRHSEKIKILSDQNSEQQKEILKLQKDKKITKHPAVWVQSLIIIALLGTAVSLYFKKN